MLTYFILLTGMHRKKMHSITWGSDIQLKWEVVNEVKTISSHSLWAKEIIKMPMKTWAGDLYKKTDPHRNMLIEFETILESQVCEYGQYSLLRSLQTHPLCPPLLFLAIAVTITLVEN